MERVNKHTVLKIVRNNKVWHGYISPNKVNAANVNGFWHLGMDIVVTIDRENNYCVASNSSQDWEFLSDYLNSFKYYNCNSELGQNVVFWH